MQKFIGNIYREWRLACKKHRHHMWTQTGTTAAKHARYELCARVHFRWRTCPVEKTKTHKSRLFWSERCDCFDRITLQQEHINIFLDSKLPNFEKQHSIVPLNWTNFHQNWQKCRYLAISYRTAVFIRSAVVSFFLLFSARHISDNWNVPCFVFSEAQRNQIKNPQEVIQIQKSCNTSTASA